LTKYHISGNWTKKSRNNGGERELNQSQIKYHHDVAVLKDYGGRGCKLILFKTLRTKGFEDVEKPKKGSVNDEKLDQNISRARSEIFELAYCNDWQYFTTFTIDGNKCGRYDLEKYHKTFRQWLSDYNRGHDTHIKYLTIPEQHKDGAWHEHGFIMGLPQEHLRLFDAEHEKLPKYIRDKLLAGFPVYDFPAYREKFGWCDFEPIKSLEGVSKYVTKYISKDLAKSVTATGAHLYYHSTGLAKATEIKKGTLSDTQGASAWDYENDWVKVAWYNTSEPVTVLAEMIT
jgi:hypothetical protein